MARIERIESTQPIAVEQAQLIDPNAFRLSTAGAEALKTIGVTVEELERQRKIQEELEKRRQAARDSLSINRTSESRDLAKLQIEQFKQDNPDPEKWAEGIAKILNNQKTIFTQQNFSAEVLENEQVEQDAFENEQGVLTQIAITGQTIENDITTSGKNLINKIANDDGSPTDAADIDKHIKLYQEALERKVSKEVADIQMEETLKAAQKQQIENVKKDIMNRAAVRPGLVKSAIDVELKQRNKGKKGLDEFNLLSNTDLEAIKDYANSVGEKAVSDSAIAANTAIEDSYAKIINKDTDIGAMIAEIQANPNISEEDSTKATDKIVTFFSKWNSAKVAEESDEDIYDELTRASESVERGALSPAEFEELYVDKKQFLTSEDQRVIRSKDIVATKTMQNRTFSDAMSVTLPTFVEITESQLGAIVLARQNAEIIKDLERVNFFNIAIKKNQAQRWNFGRFRKELRSQIDQNPEWSQKQIFTAQEVLVEQLDISDGELLKQFDTQNPRRAIMKTPPDIRFKDIWPDLSIDDKALIWSERMAGTPVDVLLSSDEVIEAQSTRRPSDVKKGVGFLGELSLPGGGVATEFSVGTTDVTGEELNIPTLVPTLTQKEIDLMVNDIIPNKKKVPDAIFKKAVAYAKKRIKQGKGVFFRQGE
ncbi:hypothetical protein LCGC14_1430010 [marine sediment metagenome]|uniref:Uncharacterized protein n=1 Tax=marine sediment metagenome TaxID=412755 RepID=A0A0F9KA38_9ZZZZ